MKTTGTINGIVRNERDLPLADCSVVILSGPTHNDILPLSNKNGRFSIGDLLPGNYIIKVYSSFSSTDKINVQVRQNRASLVEVWFDTNEKVDSENGEPDFVDEV